MHMYGVLLISSGLRSSMAEQRTLNATVGGSTPLVGTPPTHHLKKFLHPV